jgi:hypothetical protein
MKRGERPVAYRSHMTMLDWIEVDVIGVIPQIIVILDPVFPEATLPDATLAP